MSCTNGAFAGQFMPYCGCGKKGMCLYPLLDFRSFLQKPLSYVLFFFFKIYLKKIDFFQNIA